MIRLTKWIFLLHFIFFARLTWASEIEIGSNVNSGFENKSCEELIKSNLKFQAESGLNERAIETALQNCPANTIFARRRNEDCRAEIERGLKMRYRDMMNGFVAALEVRRSNYDIIHVKPDQRVNIKPECRNASARNLVRPISMSDHEYISKLRYTCTLTAEYQVNGRMPLADIYANNNAAKSALQDREKCQRFLIEYTNILYPRNTNTASPTAPSSDSTDYPAHSTAGRHVRLAGCRPFSCDFLEKNLTNNPSRCYRESYLECVSGNNVLTG